MDYLNLWENSEFSNVRIMVVNDELWFIGKDICQFFGDTNHNRTISRVDECDKRVIEIRDTLGRSQNAIAVNESGMYSILFTMQPQKANSSGVSDAYPTKIQERFDKVRRFKHWVTSEVLPSIRKTGGYTMRNQEEDKNIYLEAARIMGNIPNSRRYVVNILRHIVPDINDGESSENKTSSSGYTKPWNAIGFSSYLDRIHMSTSELSELTGLGRSQISGYKNGFIRPGEVARKRITDALNLQEGHFSRESRRRK